MMHSFRHCLVRLCPAAIVLLAVLAFAMAAGCSTVHEAKPWVVEPDAPVMEKPAMPWRLGLLPLVVSDGFRAEAERTNSAASRDQYAYVPEPEQQRQLVRELSDAMQQMGCVADVRMMTAAEGRELDAVLAEAWDAGLDIVARPVLRRRHCSHVGSTGARVPVLILWVAVLQGITWWIADETFAGEVAIGIEFYSTSGLTADPLAVREIAARVEHDLDDFDQGFNLFNAFITPGGMSSGAWEDVGRKLVPLATRECQRAVVEAACNPDTGFAANLFARRDRLQKTLAIICGGAAESRAPRYAGDDARRLHQLLLGGTGEPVCAPRGVRLLDGLHANRHSLLGAIDELFGEHARPDDTLLLTLVAPGTVAPDGTARLDLQPGNNDPLPVAELATALRTLPGRLTVVAAIDWRMVESHPGTGPPRLPDPLDPIRAIPGAAVFAATDLDHRDLLELEHARTSLFVDQLIRAILAGRETDADEDGQLSWDEIAEAIAGPIRELSMLEGTPQAPRLTGPTATRDAPLLRTVQTR